ncbi:MAG TPA: lasso peptide biosynthesis B2 protein [Novosphingobium sp.]|nr:lasso peptide biosynthesis B2 protein [Novosphingobium sp.]
MRARERWAARAVTLEAAALLIVARGLVRWVPFGRWRHGLGRPVTPETGDDTLRLARNLTARRLARAVERGAARLPGESKCLPRAIALHWLLVQRGLGATLVIGVTPGARRGGLDDLHAWVVREGEVLIGASAGPHVPLFAATKAVRHGN